MKNNLSFPFHLVTISPWPIFISFSLYSFMMSMLNMFNFHNNMSLMLSLMLIISYSYQWWRDIVRESTFQGYHPFKVINGLKMGMILFIISEIFFFLSFFWAYFHMFLSPSIEIGMIWPPMSMNYILISPFHLPLLNTIILVSSGMFLSMAHYAMLKKNFYNMNIMTFLTILFGLIFTIIQLHEYYFSNYSIFSSNFGSTFFMMTGFHGIHVTIGTLFIIFNYLRMNFNHFSNIHHFGFEASAWYWHFVDVVWLFLFLFVYWWPYE